MVFIEPSLFIWRRQTRDTMISYQIKEMSHLVKIFVTTKYRAGQGTTGATKGSPIVLQSDILEY